jgi:hypothetical protein
MGVAILLLGATYGLLVAAFRILALPRFEIPYVEPGTPLGCFGRYDPDVWLALALAALGLSWAPLGWAEARRSRVTRCLAGLAVLVAALGLAWLVVVARGTRAILGALLAWRVGEGVSHPGSDYLSYELFLAVAQVGLGLLSLALALLCASARLQQRWRFRAEAVAAARAGLLLALGAALSVRSAWLNESGCFPLWPAFRRDAPESWDGLWTTSLGFYSGCSLLVFVAWPAARRRAWFAAPLVLAAVYVYHHGSWGPQLACQAIDVPSTPVSTTTTGAYPAAREWSFGPSEAVQLSERGLTWQRRQFDDVPAFLVAHADGQRLQRSLWGFEPPPAPTSLALRVAPGAPFELVRQAVAGAKAAGFIGVTFELASEPFSDVDVGWGIQIPVVSLMRVRVPFADRCHCELDLGPDQPADAWQRAQAKLTREACCIGTTATDRR